MTALHNQLQHKRIFIGTTEIAGYYQNLAKGLDVLGINYKYIQLSPNTSGFGSQSKLPYLIRLPYLLARVRLKISVEPGLYSVHKTKKGMLAVFRFLFYFFECLLRVFIVLPWAILNFDIFCFGARSNIVGIKTGYWDIALLKLFGKQIIYVYHGSDSRPPFINGSILHNLLDRYPNNWDKKLNRLIRQTKNAVLKVDKYADIIIDNPYSAHFQRKPFINWFSIGTPFYGTKKAVVENNFHDRPLRILHAPTHRVAKGSAIIEECIKRLQREGYSLELVMLSGRPHADVIEEIQKCDFVIDELYSDAFMAGFATEASFYGKPVIVCGYVEDEELKQRIPTYYCKPAALESAVLKFITEPEFRRELGKVAQRFVEQEWSYIKIAERFVKIFADNVPNHWYLNPNEIRYFHGFGITEELLQKIIYSLVQKQGVSVLQLDDKPALRDAFLSFSKCQEHSSLYKESK